MPPFTSPKYIELSGSCIYVYYSKLVGLSRDSTGLKGPYNINASETSFLKLPRDVISYPIFKNSLSDKSCILD